MKNSKFLLALIVVFVAMMAVGFLQYGLLMKDFYKDNAGISGDLYTQVFRSMEQMDWTTGILSTVAAALLLTTVLVWGGFTSTAAGAKAGAVVCMLVGIIVDFGLMSYTHLGTMKVGLVDIVVNIAVGAIVGALGGMVLSKGTSMATA